MRHYFVTVVNRLWLLFILVMLAGCEVAVLRLPGGAVYVGVTAPEGTIPQVPSETPTPTSTPRPTESVLPTPDPTPTREVINRGERCNVTGGTWYIRAGAGRDQMVVGVLAPGDCVEVDNPLITISADGLTWVQVFVDGYPGWVADGAFG